MYVGTSEERKLALRPIHKSQLLAINLPGLNAAGTHMKHSIQLIYRGLNVDKLRTISHDGELESLNCSSYGYGPLFYFPGATS